MPIGSQKIVQARGSLRTVTTVSNKLTGALSERDESRPMATKTFAGTPAQVGVEHSSSMCISYQTVVSKCSIQLPVEANDDAISDGFSHAWAIVEQELAQRAAWAKEVLDTLVEAKAAAEGK